MSGPADLKELDRFLESLNEGELVSTGSFTVSTEKMLEKLGQAVSEHELWVVKFAQAAVACRAGLLIAKVERRTMALTAFADEHPSLTSADGFLEEAQRSRAHFHLLLSFLWATRSSGAQRVRLRWSTEASVEEVGFEDGKFYQTGKVLAQPLSFRFLKLELSRLPQTVAQKVFRIASFSGELALLAKRTYLADLSLYIDGRKLHGEAYTAGADRRAVLERPGSHNRLSFGLPRRLMPALDPDRRRLLELQWKMGKRPESYAYAESVSAQGDSIFYWMIDGVVVEAEAVSKAAYRNPHYHIFLAAEENATDVSTLSIRRDQDHDARISDSVLWHWLYTI